jgi:hypothetical protein
MNFQRQSNDSSLPINERYKYVKIGTWQNGNLTVDDNMIFWPNRAAQANVSIVESFCARPCGHGEIKVINFEDDCEVANDRQLCCLHPIFCAA